MAVGFQVIAQLHSEVHKLHVNQSTESAGLVTVLVERDGEYQVSIFAIRDGMGILESKVEYTDQIIVGEGDTNNNSGKQLLTWQLRQWQ